MSGFVQSLGSVGSSSATTTLVLTLPTITTVAVGDYVFVAVQGNNSTSWSMADSRGNTYTLEKQETTAAPFTGIFKAQVASGKQLVTGDTITWTTASQGGRTMVAGQYTGLSTGTLDQSAVNNGTTVSALTVTDATANSQANTLCISALGTVGTSTGITCTGFTVEGSVASSGTIHTGALADKVVSAVETTSAAWSWTTAGNAGGALCTYALTGGGGGGTTLHEILMLGVGV